MLRLVMLFFFMTICLPAFAVEKNWKALEERRCLTQDEAFVIFKEIEKSDLELSFALPDRISVFNRKYKNWKAENLTRKKLENYLSREKKKNFLIASFSGFDDTQIEELRSYLSKFEYKRLVLVRARSIGWNSVVYDSLNHKLPADPSLDPISANIVKNTIKSESITICQYQNRNENYNISSFRVIDYLKGSKFCCRLPVRTSSVLKDEFPWIIFIENAVPVDGAFETCEPDGIVKYSPENLRMIVIQLNKLGTGRNIYDEDRIQSIIEKVQKDRK